MIANPSREDLAWAAGIIDGEGSLSIWTRPGRRARWSIEYQMTLRVRMCHRPTLEQLQRIFGVGSLVARRKQQDHYIQPWEWLVYRLDALCVLEQVRPYLITKREEAEVFLLFPHNAGLPVGTPLPEEILLEREKLRERLLDLKRPEWRIRDSDTVWK